MDFDKYKNTDTLPKPSDFGVLSRSFRHSFEVAGVDEKIAEDDKNLAAYAEARDAHRRKTRELNEMFEKDAIQAVGLSDHPHKDKIFRMAWDAGHAHGLQEVLFFLEELAVFTEDDPRNQPVDRSHPFWSRLRGGRGGSYHRDAIDGMSRKITKREADVLYELVRNLEDDAERVGQRNGARNPHRR